MKSEPAKFSKSEEEYIKSQVEKYQSLQKQAEIDAEIRNRILDAQREMPGYRYG